MNQFSIVMRLIALHPKYQLIIEPALNRIFYQNFGPMQAAGPPRYRADWTAALAEMRAGFHILSDMQVVNQTTNALLADFQAVERLIVARGVHIVAEVHLPGLPTRRHTDEVTTSRAMLVCQFLCIWEAAHFLDYL